MKLAFRITVKETGKYTDDFDSIMDKSGLDSRLGFEDIGIQADGTPVVFDKCGNFSYLSDEFEMVIMVGEEVINFLDANTG